jgi:outer membrane immunogenic protein
MNRAIVSFALASLGLVFGASAFAAELRSPAPAPVYTKAPVAVPPSWTGFYVGANVGGAWGRDPVISGFSCPRVGSCLYNVPENLAAASAAGTGTLSDSGFTGGGQLGYNWQFGSVVLGAETDFEYFKIRASRIVTGPFPNAISNFTVGTSVNTDWLYTLRGRVGYAFGPQFLVYGTGGLAVTQASLSNSFIDNLAALGLPPNSVGASGTSDTWTGYAVGGGLEWLFARNWSVKGEYLYVNFGSKTTTATVFSGAAIPNVLTTSGTFSASIARAGVNYHF